MRVFALVLIMIVLPAIALAKHEHPEKWYQQKWCKEQGGQVEVVLPDGTSCDCLTNTHAVEFDFGPKWAEAIGRALYYGLQTGKKPAVVLILEDEQDYITGFGSTPPSITSSFRSKLGR